MAGVFSPLEQEVMQAGWGRDAPQPRHRLAPVLTRAQKNPEQKPEAQGLAAQPAQKLLQKLILPSERWTAAASGGEETLPAGAGPAAAAARSWVSSARGKNEPDPRLGAMHR